jgi:eukaryotic-like serine/threonine-protein kinase
LATQANTEAYYGRFRSARRFSQSAVRSAENEDDRRSMAWWRWDEVQREVEVGNAEQARQKAREAVKMGLEPTDSPETMASIGEIAPSERLAAKLGRDRPQDTIVQKCSLPTIRATISLKRNDPRGAIEALESAIPYELGGDGSSLYPAYLRGQAYLRLGRGQQAAAEFQKLLDHPGIVLNNVTGALAHLQLGRAQWMMGDKAAARRSYNDFLTLWKDADPEIPILKQAKAEYSKLQ